METRVHTTHTHTHKRILSSACWPAHPRTADSPKDGHNLFYNRLVSAQVENVTTYLCWQDAIPERAINRRGLTALPSASRAPSTSNPTTAAPTPTTTSSCCTLSQSKLWLFFCGVFSLINSLNTSCSDHTNHHRRRSSWSKDYKLFFVLCSRRWRQSTCEPNKPQRRSRNWIFFHEFNLNFSIYLLQNFIYFCIFALFNTNVLSSFVVIINSDSWSMEGRPHLIKYKQEYFGNDWICSISSYLFNMLSLFTSVFNFLSVFLRCYITTYLFISLFNM